MVELAHRAYNVNPNLPVPLRTGEAGEIAIDNSEDSDSSGIMQLLFEDDTECPFDVETLLTDAHNMEPEA